MTIRDGIASKTTSQHAPLEQFLTYLRTRKVLAKTQGSVVLDFGCGAHFQTLKAIGSRAKARFGLDAFFKNTPAFTTVDGMRICGSFADVQASLEARSLKVDLIISLACFEHLDSTELRAVLSEMNLISSASVRVIGTIPTPRAKPILEFLSYRLRLIDPSQIEDHKVYYDRSLFEAAIQGSGWKLVSYRRFQLGCNSYFELAKSPI